jgi:hypothetical protein
LIIELVTEVSPGTLIVHFRQALPELAPTVVGQAVPAAFEAAHVEFKLDTKTPPELVSLPL